MAASSSLETTEKIAAALDIYHSMSLSMGDKMKKPASKVSDNELLHLFNKTQDLDDDLKKSVIDFLDAFLLKQGLKK